MGIVHNYKDVSANNLIYNYKIVKLSTLRQKNGRKKRDREIDRFR